MVRLPKEFLKWNFYGRRRLILDMLEGKVDAGRLIEFTRHTPVLCVAAYSSNGNVEVNGKVVGVGYVVKSSHIRSLLKELKAHLEKTDRCYREAQGDRSAMRKVLEEHTRRGLKILLNKIYLDRDEAEKLIDFEKLSTIELAARIPWSSKHTWNLVQMNGSKACLVFYQPPSISFEVRGRLTVHLNDEYHGLVTLLHDSYHYTPPERRFGRPVYLIHVEEVYDNSPTSKGFGRKIA